MSNRYIRIILVAIALLAPSLAGAQSPRKVLLEEITNTNVAAALPQDSIFQWEYASDNARLQRVVPIIYHSNYPGVDSVNALNAAVHNGRVAFYGNDTPPVVRVNGRIPSEGNPYPGAPGDTASISKAIDAVAGTMSPLTIIITQKVVGQQIKATVKVSSSEAISGKRLYIAGMNMFASYQNAGSHSLGTYYFLPQGMFPDADGAELTLAAGETKEFTAAFSPSQFFLTSNYFVAFVQDPATKEVLQAEHSITIPSLVADRPKLIRQPGNEAVEWNMDVTTTIAGTYQTFVLTNLPEGWTYSVKHGDRELAEYDEVPLKPLAPEVLKVTITPSAGSANRKGFVYVIVNGTTGYSASSSHTVVAGDPETLLMVVDRNTSGINAELQGTLDSVGGTYATVFDGEDEAFDLSKHIVLMATGKQSLARHEIESLRAAIDKGARIFLTGAEIAFTLADPANTDPNLPRDPAFIRDYLHASYLGDKSASMTVNGKGGDPVGTGMSFAIDDGMATQDAPDVIGAIGGAEPAFYYGSGTAEVAGIRYADAKNRLIYLGFGLEGIGDREKREELMRKGIEWLRGSSGVQNVSGAMAIGAPWPNPTRGAITIPLGLPAGARVRASIIDSRGEEALATGEMAADGSGMFTLDCSSLPAGAYRIVTRSAAGVATAPIIIIR